MVIRGPSSANREIIKIALSLFLLGCGSFVLLWGCSPSSLETLECNTPNLREVYSPQLNPQSPPQLDEKIFENKYWALEAQFCLPRELSFNLDSPSVTLHSSTLIFQIEPLPNDQGRIMMNFLENPSGQRVNENSPLPLASSQWIPAGIYDKNTSLNQVYFEIDLNQNMNKPLVKSLGENLEFYQLAFNLEVGTQKQDQFAGDCTLITQIANSSFDRTQNGSSQMNNQYSVPGICQLVQLNLP